MKPLVIGKKKKWMYGGGSITLWWILG